MRTINKITYYDFTNLNYSGFFLTGFFQNQRRFNYKLQISKRVPSLLASYPKAAEWSRKLFAISLYKVKLFKDEFYFCIDAHDINKTNGFHIPLLDKVRYYFKVNYNANFVLSDSDIKPLSHKIIPASIVLPIRPPKILSFLPRVVPSNAMGWTIQSLRQRVRAIRKRDELLSLEELITLRNVKKDLDLFFATTFYSQKHHFHISELRYQIMKEICKHKDIASITAFNTINKLPGKFAEFQSQRTTLRAYLKNLARSKIAIYTRGCHECLSFKFGEALALGLPIVGQPIVNNRDQIYNNDHFSEQFAFEDPKEIVDNVIKLLNEPKKLGMLAESNARIFDSKFTPQVTTAEILQRLFG